MAVACTAQTPPLLAKSAVNHVPRRDGKAIESVTRNSRKRDCSTRPLENPHKK